MVREPALSGWHLWGEQRQPRPARRTDGAEWHIPGTENSKYKGPEAGLSTAWLKHREQGEVRGVGAGWRGPPGGTDWRRWEPQQGSEKRPS